MFRSLSDCLGNKKLVYKKGKKKSNRYLGTIYIVFYF